MDEISKTGNTYIFTTSNGCETVEEMYVCGYVLELDLSKGKVVIHNSGSIVELRFLADICAVHDSVDQEFTFISEAFTTFTELAGHPTPQSYLSFAIRKLHNNGEFLGEEGGWL